MKDLVNDGFRNVVKPYIDREDKKSREIIAPVEVSPAEAAHNIGDQIVYNGILYDVTAAIAIGDALATSGAGENISEADDIITQMKNHTVTTDATPTKNSTNPVQSGGVYESEQDIFEIMGENGAKNHIFVNLKDAKEVNTATQPDKGSWSGNTWTFVGLPHAVNDGEITISGTQTGSPVSFYFSDSSTWGLVNGETYVISANASGTLNSNHYYERLRLTKDDTQIAEVDVADETITFTYDSSSVYKLCIINREANISHNYTIKPMICPKLWYDIDPTYQPFAETNQELTENKVSWDDFSEMGSVNILENDATTQTTSGITFTRNADGSITCSGTATANITYNIKTQPKMEDGKKYLLKSFQSGSSANAYLSYSDIQSADFGDYDGNGVIITKFDYSTYPNSKIRLRILSGTSFETPMTFYPLLTPILDYSGPYAPHAMTNRELTKEIDTTGTTSLSNSGTDYELIEGFIYKKRGVNILRVAVKCNTPSPIAGGSHIKFSELPSGFSTPPAIIYTTIPCYRDGTTNISAELQISTNGNLAIRGGEAGARYSGLFAF